MKQPCEYPLTTEPQWAIMTKKPSPRAKNMKFDFLQDQVRIQTFALQILIIQQSHVWWMANPCVSELSFSLYWRVIHTMHVIYLIQHWHWQMPRCQRECPKMPQALQEKLRGGFQNMRQVTVTGRLTSTGRFLVCDDDRRGLKAERDCAWEMSRMPLHSQAGASTA